MTENKSRIIENGTRIIESRLLLIKNNGINKNLPWTFSDFAFQNNNLTCQRTIFYIIKAKFYIFVNYKKTSTPSGILSPQPKTATRESLESG